MDLTRVWMRLLRHRAAAAGFLLLLAMVVIAVFAPVLAPYPPDAADFAAALQPPGADHRLGTDEHGRDVLSRLIHGTRLSLTVGVVSVAVGLTAGTAAGAAAGYLGGCVDTVVMRLMDMLLAFPTFLLAVAVVFMLGPGLEKAVLAVSLVSIPAYARIARGAVLSVRETEYVQAARATGASHRRTLARHVFPNIFAPLLVRATLGASEAILETAALGFLGLGARLPAPEWGLMLARGAGHLYDAPHLVYYPGIAITAAVLALNLAGDGLRDALDPRLQ